MRSFIILAAFGYVVQAQFGFLNKPLGNIANTASKGASSIAQGASDAASASGQALSSLVEGQWTDFLKNKNYDPTELLFRKNVFIENTKRIADFAAQTASGAVTFALKMNPLGDLPFDEFNKLFNGFKGSLIGGSTKAEPYVPSKKQSVPESIDWRERGAVTPVKNQQKCAGCWAFSVAGAIEGLRAVKTGKLEEVSIQNLIDCSKGKKYGENEGCQGGLLDGAFDYVLDHGANSHSGYPFEAKDGNCRFTKDNIVANCTGYVRIPKGNEKALEQALATNGPISVAIHVIPHFQFYSSGVFHDPSCGNKESDLNHAILLVGYGKEANGQKYWLLKNSYGPEWGMEGYFKLAKDAGNHCGVATYARFPTA